MPGDGVDGRARGTCIFADGLAFGGCLANRVAVWNQPYLETCCRAALHRLHLCGQAGRPAGQMDEPCQHRLVAMGLCRVGRGGRFTISQAGQQRHATEVLKTSSPATADRR